MPLMPMAVVRHAEQPRAREHRTGTIDIDFDGPTSARGRSRAGRGSMPVGHDHLRGENAALFLRDARQAVTKDSSAPNTEAE